MNKLRLFIWQLIYLFLFYFYILKHAHSELKFTGPVENCVLDALIYPTDIVYTHYTLQSQCNLMGTSVFQSSTTTHTVQVFPRCKPTGVDCAVIEQ